MGSEEEEERVGSDGEEEESEGEGVMNDTVSGDTPKVLVRKAEKEELSVEGELEKERQFPKEVLEKLQQQRIEGDGCSGLSSIIVTESLVVCSI